MGTTNIAQFHNDHIKLDMPKLESNGFNKKTYDCRCIQEIKYDSSIYKHLEIKTPKCIPPQENKIDEKFGACIKIDNILELETINVKSYHISCRSYRPKAYKGYEELGGIILYLKDGKTDWFCNGIHCKIGYIIIKRVKDIKHFGSIHGQIHGNVYKSVFGEEPKNVVGSGFSYQPGKKNWVFRSGVFNGNTINAMGGIYHSYCNTPDRKINASMGPIEIEAVSKAIEMYCEKGIINSFPHGVVLYSEKVKIQDKLVPVQKLAYSNDLTVAIKDLFPKIYKICWKDYPEGTLKYLCAKEGINAVTCQDECDCKEQGNSYIRAWQDYRKLVKRYLTLKVGDARLQKAVNICAKEITDKHFEKFPKCPAVGKTQSAHISVKGNGKYDYNDRIYIVWYFQGIIQVECRRPIADVYQLRFCGTLKLSYIEFNKLILGLFQKIAIKQPQWAKKKAKEKELEVK